MVNVPKIGAEFSAESSHELQGDKRSSLAAINFDHYSTRRTQLLRLQATKLYAQIALAPKSGQRLYEGWL